MRARIATSAGLGLAFSAILGVGCSPHFPAVKAAGIAGEDMAKQASALGASLEICRDAKALTRGTSSCDDVAKQVVRWGKISGAMGAYSARLAALADAKDVSAEDPLESVLAAGTKAEVLALTNDQDSAIASFAGAVVGVLSERYRAHVLEDAIGHTDPSLQRIIASLKGEAELRLGEIKRAEGAIDKINDVLVLGAMGPGNATASPTDIHVVEATSAALLLMRQDLERRAALYAKLEASATAFGAAHAALAKHLGDLNAEGVIDEVVHIVSAGDAAVRRLKAGSAASTSTRNPGQL